MDGWLSLHRKIRKNPIFNDHQLLRLWLICLTEAYFKPCNVLIGKQDVFVNKGEFPTGRFDLHRMYNDGLNAKEVVSEKTIWRWLEKLEKLDFLTIKSTNKFSIVSVVNWDKYQNNDQQNDQQMTIKRPTNDQQMTTKNKVNKDNNLNNKNTYAEFVTMTEEEYQKLVSNHGDQFTKKCIEVLDNHKGAKGQKYKSDYRAILKWVVEKVEKDSKVTPFPTKGFKPNVVQPEVTTISEEERERLEWIYEQQSELNKRNATIRGATGHLSSTS